MVYGGFMRQTNRWGGRELWRDTTDGEQYCVGYWVEGRTHLGARKAGFHWLYSGHDVETAREVLQWAKNKGFDVKCYAGAELERIVDLL